jgi:hypothetical protein
MWTDEARTAALIIEVVTVPVVQRILYQSQMHIENFRHSKGSLHEAFDTLGFHEFARRQSCHMTEGIFGADIHAAEMESAKIRVWGYLLNTATAGHKFLRCLRNARSRDKEKDWAEFRSDLKKLPEIYRRTRNFLEHLDESTAKEEVTTIEDCSFSRHGVLQFSDKEGPLEFDFTSEGLAPIETLWGKLIEMLKRRREVNKQSR